MPGDQSILNNSFTAGESLHIEFANRLIFIITPRSTSLQFKVSMIRSNNDVMNTLSHYATVTHDNATADTAGMSRRWKRLDVLPQRKKTLDRHRSSWNDIGGRKDTAAAPRAAHDADGRHGASGRRRKSVSERRPWGGGRIDRSAAIDRLRTSSSRSIREPTETRGHVGSFGNDVERLCHDDDVNESWSYAKTRVENISSNGVFVSSGRPGRLTSA